MTKEHAFDVLGQGSQFLLNVGRSGARAGAEQERTRRLRAHGTQ
jgi:hypothetical protein